MNRGILVLFENEDYLVVDKDRLTPVHGGKGIIENNTLLFRVKDYLTSKGGAVPDYITPAHRIDLNTRGPVIFSKSLEAHRKINREFSGGRVLKTYQVLVHGILSAPLFIQADIIKNSHKKAVVENLIHFQSGFPDKEEWLLYKDKDSKTISATILYPLQSQSGATFCEVEIWSGRYHQIRVVCEAIGHPVCGDTKYNHDPRFHHRRRTSEKYPDGQMLLCKKIEVPALGISVESRFEIEISE